MRCHLEESLGRNVRAGGATRACSVHSRAARCWSAQISVCSDGADMSYGEGARSDGAVVFYGDQARPGFAVLRGSVVRSVWQAWGPGRDASSETGCAAFQVSVCRDDAVVPTGEQARPDSAVLRGLVVRTVSAAGVSGCASSSSKCSALLLCPTTGSTGLVHMCVVAFRHPHAPLS